MFDMLLILIEKFFKNLTNVITENYSKIKKFIWQILCFVIKNKYRITFTTPLIVIVLLILSEIKLAYILWIFFCSFVSMCVAWFILTIWAGVMNLDILNFHFILSFISAILLTIYFTQSLPNINQIKSQSYPVQDNKHSSPIYHMECDGKGCYSDY